MSVLSFPDLPSAALEGDRHVAEYKRALTQQIRTVQTHLLDQVPPILYAKGVIGVLPNGGLNTVGKQVRHFLSQAEHILMQISDPKTQQINLEGRRRDGRIETCPGQARLYAEDIASLIATVPEQDAVFSYTSEFGPMRGTTTATALFEQQIQHGITHGAAIIAAGLPQAKRSVLLKCGRSWPTVMRFQVHPDLYIAPSTPLMSQS